MPLQVCADLRPNLKITLFAMALLVVSLARRDGAQTVLALVGRMGIFNLWSCRDWRLAEVVSHSSIPRSGLVTSAQACGKPCRHGQRSSQRRGFHQALLTIR